MIDQGNHGSRDKHEKKNGNAPELTVRGREVPIILFLSLSQFFEVPTAVDNLSQVTSEQAWLLPQLEAYSMDHECISALMWKVDIFSVSTSVLTRAGVKIFEKSFFKKYNFL